MRQLTARFEVHAEAERIYDLIVDPERHTEWQTAVRDVVAISGRNSGVGSSYSALYRVAGRSVEARFVVTAADRPRYHQVTGSATAGRATWTTSIDGGLVAGMSVVTVVLDYELAGNLLGGILAMFTGPRIAREFHRTYANLRALVQYEARVARELTEGAPASAATAGTGEAVSEPG